MWYNSHVGIAVPAKLFDNHITGNMAMIYTHFGTPVKLLTSELVHEQQEDSCWVPIYYVTAEQSGVSLGRADDPDAHNMGRPILDGKQFSAAELRADEGWGEVMDAVQALLPEDHEPAHEAYDAKKHLSDLRWVAA